MTTEWQPMNTAPKDRSVLLLFEARSKHVGRRVEMGRFDEDKYSKRPRPFWRQLSADYLGITVMREDPPIAWMHLPSPEGWP